MNIVVILSYFSGSSCNLFLLINELEILTLKD